MSAIAVINVAFTVLVVYLGARLAILATPRSIVDIFGKLKNDRNDLSSKTQWLIAIGAGLVVVGIMSASLVLIAHPEWLEWLNKLLEPINKWLESVLTNFALTLMTCVVVGLSMLLFTVAIKDDLQKLSRKWLACLVLVAIVTIGLAASFDNWMTSNLLAVVFVMIVGVSLQQRVSFLKFALFMNILAFAYDFVQVYVTDNMVKASSNLAPAVPGAPNPKTGELVSSLHFPSLLFLPSEWALHPTHNYMLGLGDVLPGILMAVAAARMGEWINSKLPLLMAVTGYAVGVFAAFAMLLRFDHAQPALIFIAPITSVLVIGTMKFMGHGAKLRQPPWPAPEPATRTAEQRPTTI